MPPRGVKASFYRGGTSRGLIFRAEALAPYSPPQRDDILRTALGSPDPAGRQISGLGGGVSSLSKACIVSAPGDAAEEQKLYGALPGASWADEGKKDGVQWDVVYRFAQVGVRDRTVDWSSTCGNMLSAVAIYSLAAPIIPYSTLFTRSRTLPRPEPGSPLMFPLTILSASNGAIMRARVPIDPWSLQIWEPEEGQGTRIAGVPGEEAGVEVEMPMEKSEGSDGTGLVTGAVRDVVKVDDLEIPVSILSSGLTNIFVPISSLPVPPSLLVASASTLAAHSISPLLERLRQATAAQFSLPCSLATPKVTLIGALPQEGYTTSTNEQVVAGEADLVVRAISSGDWHATIPGTTLGALNIGLGTPGSVVHELVSGGSSEQGSGEEVVTVRAAHAAGVASSSVRFVVEAGVRKPVSVVMMRTAREIMRGEVMVPERVFEPAAAAAKEEE